MWTIYTTGDSLFLRNILNGVAMITQTGDFVTVSVIGALIGITLMSFMALRTGKGIDFSGLVICVIAWNFFFGASTSVSIHDVVSGEDRQVDHVPYGVAVSGWAISSIGYNMTYMMEVGYGAPDGIATITNGGEYLGTAKILNNLVKLSVDPNVFSAIDQDTDKGINADIKNDIKNYVKDCSIAAVKLGEKSSQSFLNKSISNSALNFDTANNAYYTVMQVKAAQGEKDVVKCNAAFNNIKQQISSSLSNNQSNLNILLRNKFIGNDHHGNSSIKSPTEIVQSVLNMMNGTHAEAQTMMMSAIMYDPIFLGEMEYYRQDNASAAALMISQARQQRNQSWAAQGDMFQGMMRPVMTFMEGFTYAITPFCGFLLLMGMFGVKLSVKYFMLIAWVQSWLPCMSIANAYTNSALQRAMSIYNGSGSYYGLNWDPDSINAIRHTANVAQDYVAIGGMMVGAIPFITLFIFSGSVYALNSLTGQMSGAGFLNPKIATPDALSSGSIMQGSSIMSTQTGVASRTGFDMGSMTIGTSGSSGISSARQSVMAYEQSLGSSIIKGLGHQAKMDSNFVNSNAFQQSWNSSNSEVQNALISIGEAMTKNVKKDRNDMDKFSDGLRLGFDMLGNGVNLGSAKEISEATGLSLSKSQSLSENFSKAASGIAQSGLGDTLTQQRSDGSSIIDSGQDLQSISDNNSKLKSAREQYSETAQAQYTAGSQTTIKTEQAYQYVDQDSSKAQAAHSLFQSLAADNVFLQANKDAKLAEWRKNGNLISANQSALEVTAEMAAMSEMGGSEGAFAIAKLGDILNGVKSGENADFSINGAPFDTSVFTSGVNSNISETRGRIQEGSGTLNATAKYQNKLSPDSESVDAQKKIDENTLNIFKDNLYKAKGNDLESAKKNENSILDQLNIAGEKKGIFQSVMNKGREVLGVNDSPEFSSLKDHIGKMAEGMGEGYTKSPFKLASMSGNEYLKEVPLDSYKDEAYSAARSEVHKRYGNPDRMINGDNEVMKQFDDLATSYTVLNYENKFNDLSGVVNNPFSTSNIDVDSGVDIKGNYTEGQLQAYKEFNSKKEQFTATLKDAGFNDKQIDGFYKAFDSDINESSKYKNSHQPGLVLDTVKLAASNLKDK